mgnify:CR=1 FL=1
MNDSLLSSIGLARKAGKLILGFDAVSAACKNGTAALVLLSEDLSPKSRKEIVRVAEQYQVRYFNDRKVQTQRSCQRSWCFQ